MSEETTKVNPDAQPDAQPETEEQKRAGVINNFCEQVVEFCDNLIGEDIEFANLLTEGVVVRVEVKKDSSETSHYIDENVAAQTAAEAV